MILWVSVNNSSKSIKSEEGLIGNSNLISQSEAQVTNWTCDWHLKLGQDSAPTGKTWCYFWVDIARIESNWVGHPAGVGKLLGEKGGKKPTYYSLGKEPACQCRQCTGWKFYVWVGKIPCRRKCNALQHSCHKNPMARGACWTRVHGVTKSWTWLSIHTHTLVTKKRVNGSCLEKTCLHSSHFPKVSHP